MNMELVEDQKIEAYKDKAFYKKIIDFTSLLKEDGKGDNYDKKDR